MNVLVISIKVRQAEEEISKEISEEVAIVKTNNLLTQAPKVLNATADNLKNQLKKIKRIYEIWN